MSHALTQPATTVVRELEPPAATSQPEMPPAINAGRPAKTPAAAPVPAGSLLQALLREPARFGLDAAAAVMMRAAGTDDPGSAIRLAAAAGLGFVASDITEVQHRDGGFRATIGLMGLAGPSGVLPRHYTEMAAAEQRRRSHGLADFLDLLAQRPLAQFISAGIKYRPHRNADAASLRGEARAEETDGLRRMLLALTGYGTPHLTSRLLAGTEPILFYAGLFAARPRSADRLGALLSDWLGQSVTVEQFAGANLRLDREQRTALPSALRPGRFNRLGVDAAIGSSCWEPQARIMLRIGPLPLDRFEALLPGGVLLQRLASLVRAFLEGETGFAINPVLAADAVPPLPLGGGRRARLGWNSWLPTSTPRQRDAAEAVFDGDGIG
ncbi:MAG: type VI secretion system baseplate subunit TssG [Rhodopila sp.]